MTTESGIRLEFAQFGHFDSFDVIRSMVSMASVADVDLPTPVVTGLKTMYYVDSDVVEGLTYHYKVRVWRGATSFISDEVKIEAVEGIPIIDEFVVAFNEFDTGIAANDDPTGAVWNDYSDYWEVEDGNGILRLPQTGVAFINLPEIGTQDYTMEFFVRLDNKDYDHGQGFLFSTNYVTARSWAAIGIRNSGELTLYINGSSKGSPTLPVTIKNKILAKQWVHIAYERYGFKTTCYVEGFAVGSDTIKPDIPALKWCFGGSDSSIAASGDWFKGSIDSVRASVGIARYTEAFTPPPRGYK
ncbi:LamG domain-containing protein [Acinetobacter radioresistens]|uniref:LamG domain-containing protein n=1 Tax=Acinetobacter radioresistens TaxID=40216 RepID=UPI002005464A|nr:LamG domain-containing protein [Acinetobacter radioresistens]MCK4109858.1 LamG domain-containing protein [Acinetobacter radioresistens]